MEKHRLKLVFGNVNAENFNLFDSSYTKIFNENVNVMLKKWENMLEKPIEVFNDVSLMTLDSMLKCAMSTETDCQHIRCV